MKPAIHRRDRSSLVADLDTNLEGLDLFQSYLAKRLTDAGGLQQTGDRARPHGAVDAEIRGGLVAAQHYRDALQVYDQYSEPLLRHEAGSSSKPSGHDPARRDRQALEMVLGLFSKAGETAHLTEVYELLAHAYVQSGDLEKARAYYLKLTQLEPANQLHAQNYRQVLDKLGT